jgi:hypothetical protein
MTMAGMTFFCCSDHRRAALQKEPALNGIDFLEVSDLDPSDLDPAEAAEYALLPAKQRDRLLWQRKLTVFFVNPLLAAHLSALDAANLRIEGGERPDSRSIALTVLATSPGSIVLRASQRGDFSLYRLRIVRSAADLRPPDVFDPLLAAVDFSFKVECPSEFDCLAPQVCPPAGKAAIDLDYLARDYESFRRLMLDRISALTPAWRERHAPDLGMTLVELFAYVADYLSYRQDAAATEAYLGTARKRVSVRRHARLVDYPMHDGCNARVWVQVVLDAGAPPGGITLPYADAGTGATTKFLTRIPAAPILAEADAADAVATERPEVFELLLPPGATAPRLYPGHNELRFYTWGASDCCLPKGATRATLSGRLDKLAKGDVLIFEEVLGPKTGKPGDADPAHRCAVRLTAATLSTDPLGGQFQTPATSNPVDITEIEWSSADALLFPLCVTATIENEDKTTTPIVASVARGNIVLADHGRTSGPEDIGVVPEARLSVAAPESANGCAAPAPMVLPVRFRPELGQRPLTQAGTVRKSVLIGGQTRTERWPFDPDASAGSAMRWDMALVFPQVRLEGTLDAVVSEWDPVRDLLRSSRNDRSFLAEVESDGTARLRFGDDRQGLRPPAGTSFKATYRVGNGLRGNVGADAIAHVATNVAGIDHVRNPLPATGGVDPEPVEDVRRFAPVAFRTQERAVTADDYARMAERHPQVQKAAATFRWTGSWRTVFVTVDPFASKDPDAPFDPEMPVQLEPFRMAGHDLEIDTPLYVPLKIELQACAKRDYFRADVKRALADVFSSRVLPDGRKGAFHPDNFTFGQPLYLSRLYAAAYSVDGVESVSVSLFQRQDTPDPKPLADGKLEFGRLEIARLENDPSFPERGVFHLDVAGGK